MSKPKTHHLILVGEGEQRGEHGAEGQKQELEEQQADRVLGILQVRLLRDVQPEQTCRGKQGGAVMPSRINVTSVG